MNRSALFTGYMRFAMLGPLEVREEGRPLTIGGPQQRALLAILLVHANRVVSADRLIDELWREKPPSTARSLLQGCVAGLRRSLHSGVEGPLLTRAPGYLLKALPGQTDVDEFEELAQTGARLAETSPHEAAALFEEALALWRGVALDGIAIEVCRVEAARLEERRLAVVEQRIAIELRLGRHAGLIAEVQGLVREHPLREGLWAQLMTALHAAGRQAEALDAYRQVRELLVEQLGVEPGAGLQHLQREILSGADPAPAEVIATPKTVVPAELPAPVASFTGRERELKQLDELLSTDDLAVHVITGMAGVGKSALAVHWAHRVKDRFPDGQLYINLGGVAQTQPTRPIAALTGFLQALGVDGDQIPQEVERAAAVYRTVLNGKRLLIVLDNAASADQVRPLLPGGPGCAVLVTGRDTLGGLIAREGARHVSLDVLTPDEAHRLVRKVLGAERVDSDPAAAEELARLCAFLPLALRIAAANLTLHPHRSVEDLVAELATGNRLAALTVDGDPSSAVRATFDLSFASLSDQERHLFKLLGLVPGKDFTAGAAAALAGDGQSAVAQRLNRLVRAHLVAEHRTGRYRCHDLIQLYAMEQVSQEPAPNREAALQRLYDWYLGTADAAADLLYPNMLRLPRGTPRLAGTFRDLHQALTWLEDERHNFVAMVCHAAYPTPRPTGWQLADALRGYFHLRRYLPDWLVVANAALSAAQAAGEPSPEAAAHNSLGTAYRSRGDHRAALHHYAVALGLARRSGWRQCEAMTLGNLGLVCQKLGRLKSAARQLERALEIDRATGRRPGEANNLGNLAMVQHQMGRLEDAARNFTTALELQRLNGSRRGEALALSGLGEVCLELGRLDEATKYLTEALELAIQIGDRDGQAMIHYGFAVADDDRGRASSCRRYALTALEMAQETGDRRTEACALNALGAAHRRLRRFSDAIDCHLQARDLARETVTRRQEIDAMLGLAATHGLLGAGEQARDNAAQALDFARAGGFQVAVGLAHTALAQIHLQAGRTELAHDHAERALAIHRSCGSRLGEVRALVVLGHLAHRNERTAEAAGHWRRAFALFTDSGAAESGDVGDLLGNG